MSFENAKASYSLAKSLTAQLVRSGVQRIVLSPGFRNSALIVAAQRTPELETVTIVDERSAAFFALGAAKASGKPVALACTSGTATANYFPAVMEAFHSHVPLVLITADRPEELVGTGSNQTTSQETLYPNHTRASFRITPPAPGFDYLAHGASVMGRAVMASLNPAPGPVQVNVRFREPFLPDAAGLEEIDSQPTEPRSPSTFLPSSSGPGFEQARALQEVLTESRRAVFCVGPGNHGIRRLALIAKASRSLGIPVIAEPSSGFAFLAETGAFVHRSDSAWSAFVAEEIAAPDLIVRFGPPLLSKTYSKFLKSKRPVQAVFDEWEESRDPDLYNSLFIQGGMEGWLDAFTRLSQPERLDRDWIAALETADAASERRVSDLIRSQDKLTEWGFHSFLASVLGKNAQIFLGNSMPIRDFDLAFPRVNKRISMFSNRGQSGIDGLISSAFGIAHSGKAETHAVIGDLSAIHDLSALAAVGRLQESANFTLWILNNGGGEIFRIVQTAKSGAKEEWFTTPESVDFSAIAKAFRIPYSRVASLEDLLSLDPAFCRSPGTRIVEVMVDPVANIAVREKGRVSQ